VSTPQPLVGYRSYKDLPPLAGLCSIEDALKPGLSVEECVRRLKRIHYAFVRLHQILTARITAEPIYELKTAFAHHAYLCAEHVQALRTRVAEMREPPLGLEDVPHPALEAFFDEVLLAPAGFPFLSAYMDAIGELSSAIRNYRRESNRLTDAPSIRLLRFADLELHDLAVWCDACLVAFARASTGDGEPDAIWERRAFLAASGGLDGTGPTSDELPERHYSKARYQFDPVPRRDERFQDLWNQGVNAEGFLYSEQFPAKAKALMMLYKRLREIDVPEMMASILAQTPGKPWGYYRDMSRQLWDEARHAMMGEVGFVALGVDWTQARITFNWSYRLNTECTPLERHAVLFFIEQGLMPKTGKRYEYEVGRESGLPIIATIQDFDWADEVLHSQIGRQWLVPDFGGLAQALKYGDECWSRILSNWTTVREKGLTQHANWWPGIYSQACRSADEAPDPAVLAFDETYEAKRADIHRGIVAE
jgi:hypothetical protein